MTIAIHALDPSEGPDLFALDDYAFVADPTRPGREHGGEEVVWEQAFGARRGDDPRLAGAYLFHNLQLAAPGPLGRVRAHDLAGLSWVGVHPDHRRQGVLSALIRHHFIDLHDRGIAWSGLHASETSIYGRFGYAVASLGVEYTVGRGSTLATAPAVAAAADALEVRTLLNVDDDEVAARLRRISLNCAASTLGAVIWPPAKERAVLRDVPEGRRGSEPLRALIAHRPAGATAAGADVGYAVYRRNDRWERGRPDGTVDVRLLHARDSATLLALGRRLLDMDLMARTKFVERGLDDPLLWWAGGPRAVAVEAYDGLWLRPIDVGLALSGRGYAGACAVVLDVEDDMCPWNAGRWRLSVGEDGFGTCERTPDRAEVRLQVQALGSVYLGLRGWTALAATGEVREETAGALASLSRAFATGCAPVGGVCF